MDESNVARFWAKVEKTEDCWIWTGCTRDGYGLFRLDKKMVSAHRFSYGLVNDEVPRLLRHTCDNPPCVRPDHLIPGTRLDNSRDMKERDRGLSSMTNEQVIEARRRAAGGESIHEILKDIPIDIQALAKAIRGISFTHLPGECEPSFFKPLYRKLTEQEYTEIRRALERPYRGLGKKLAEKYGVHPSMITLIKQGKVKTAPRDS